MVTVSGVPAGTLRLGEAAGLPCAEVLSRLGGSAMGLSSAEAARRLQQFGPNALGTHRVRAVTVVLRQVRNPILILLLGAALVSGLTGGGTNALIIAVIVALSVGLGFFSIAAISLNLLSDRHHSRCHDVPDGRAHRDRSFAGSSSVLSATRRNPVTVSV
jgi:magnesium-transporting ATPase (P-type)